MGWFSSIGQGVTNAQQQAQPPQGALGSLGLLGGGLNGPQPVPGMPPQPMRDFMPIAPGGPIYGGGHDSTGMPLISDGPGNRGSGQPLNQPMVPGSGPGGTWMPQDTARFTQNSGPMPASGGGFVSQPMGSLQSLGVGGQQGGMVNLRGPDGSMKAVPQDQLQHWLSKGAQQVGGGSGEQMVNNGWGRMVPKSQMDAFYASGGMT